MTCNDRRFLLRLLGAAPFLCLSRAPRAMAAPAITPLKYYGTGTLDIGKDNWKKAELDVGVKIEFTDNGNDVGPVLSQMINGTASREYDIGGLQGGAEPELFRANTILPWETSKLAMWSDIWDWMKQIPHLNVDGKQIGIPVVVNADSMIYLEKETGVVDSYASVFDKKFKGRASMEDAWMNSVIFTAIFMKENNVDGMSRIRTPGDLEEDELRTVMEFLKRHKRDGQFLKFWNGWQEGVDLITSRQVVVMTGWEPIVYAARKQGVVDARYAVPKEGYEGWSNNLILHAGAARRGRVDAAHRFADWQLGGWYGCVLGGLRGYMVPTDRCSALASSGPVKYLDINQAGGGAEALVSKEAAVELREHVKEKFLAKKGRIYWQNARPKHYQLYQREWASLRAI